MNTNGEAPFRGAQDVFDWMSQFINLERGQSGKSFRLDRMEFLADMAGRPEGYAPAVHVAGSKGKGSVTTMVASILNAAGLKTARYVSPHVVEYRERISLADRFFDEVTYAAAGEELRRLVTRSVREKPELFDPRSPEGEEPTFFELATLFFFLCAQEACCDAAALETGMGGRLDATNIVNPAVSVITPIELEHTEILGSTVEAIAAEKAGIIKNGKPLVLAYQGASALEVFRRTARERNAPLYYLPDLAEISDLRVGREGTAFSLRFRGEGPFPRPLRLQIPAIGEVQAANAALAVAAVSLAFPAVGEDAVMKGLEDIVLPARFELMPGKHPVILDGAHTPRSVGLCADTFGTIFGDGGVLLFACAADKDAAALARILSPRFSRIVVTAPGSFKKSNPRGVYQAFREVSAAQAVDLCLEPDTAAAIAHAVSLAETAGLPLLVAGSFYLAAEARKILLKFKD